MTGYDRLATMDATELLRLLGVHLHNAPVRCGAMVCDIELTPNLMGALVRYTRDHIRPGTFLCEVLAGDLASAIFAADLGSLIQLKNVLMFVGAFVPASARGSRAAIDAWCSSKETPDVPQTPADGDPRPEDPGPVQR